MGRGTLSSSCSMSEDERSDEGRGYSSSTWWYTILGERGPDGGFASLSTRNVDRHLLATQEDHRLPRSITCHDLQHDLVNVVLGQRIPLGAATRGTRHTATAPPISVNTPNNTAADVRIIHTSRNVMQSVSQ
jgi:hypothetical protein